MVGGFACCDVVPLRYFLLYFCRSCRPPARLPIREIAREVRRRSPISKSPTHRPCPPMLSRLIPLHRMRPRTAMLLRELLRNLHPIASTQSSTPAGLLRPRSLSRRKPPSAKELSAGRPPNSISNVGTTGPQSRVFVRRSTTTQKISRPCLSWRSAWRG